MDDFTENFIAGLPPIDGFLFKSGSPTIGFYNIKVYDKPVGSSVANRTSGIFARKILRHFPGYPIEDDQRLRNKKIRDEFMTRVFAFAGFSEAVEIGDSDAVRDFHERNRYLFMSYDYDAREGLSYALAIEDYTGYSEKIKRLLGNSRTAAGLADTALLLFKRYEGRLSGEEIAWFRDLIDKFLKNKVSRDGLLEPLEMFAVRMSDWQIADRTLFSPYPRELIQDVDEDLDRDYQKAMRIPG